jgi:hypothetical protein
MVIGTDFKAKAITGVQHYRLLRCTMMTYPADVQLTITRET